MPRHQSSWLRGRASASFCLGIIHLSKEIQSALCNLGKTRLCYTARSLLRPSKLHNMSFLKRPVIPFGIRKPISDCLLLVGGARTGVRELGRMWERLKERKGPGRWRGQEGSGGQGLGIKLIGVSAKSVIGFGDSKGRHVPFSHLC